MFLWESSVLPLLPDPAVLWACPTHVLLALCFSPEMCFLFPKSHLFLIFGKCPDFSRAYPSVVSWESMHKKYFLRPWKCGYVLLSLHTWLMIDWMWHSGMQIFIQNLKLLLHWLQALTMLLRSQMTFLVAIVWCELVRLEDFNIFDLSPVL